MCAGCLKPEKQPVALQLKPAALSPTSLLTFTWLSLRTSLQMPSMCLMPPSHGEVDFMGTAESSQLYRSRLQGHAKQRATAAGGTASPSGLSSPTSLHQSSSLTGRLAGQSLLFSSLFFSHVLCFLFPHFL